MIILTRVRKQCKHVDIMDKKRKHVYWVRVLSERLKNVKFIWWRFSIHVCVDIFSLSILIFPAKIVSSTIKLYIDRIIPNCFYIEHPFSIVYLISNLLSSFASGHLRMKKLRTSILEQTFFASIYTQFYLCLFSNWKTIVI